MSMYPQHMRFTSESVTEGHPDKLCDQISDAVLDECLRQDPESRVACEAYATMGLLVVGGEITSQATFDVAAVVRALVAGVGYTAPQYGLDAGTCAVANLLHAQSPDIALGVSRADRALGAGDQGLMFGYACRQTPELMPLPIVLAHRLVRRLAEIRKGGVLPWLGPDGKAQVTIEYRDGRPRRAAWVVVAAQHTADAVTPDGRFTSEEAKRAIVDTVVLPVLGDLVDADTTITVNGTGKFLVGGSQADTGLTGRKNIVDTYGGWAPHGGGAFSGKDPTKVDRSAGYMARYIAKNLVAAELAEHCLVQLAYCIGLADPVSVMVNTHGTGARPDDDLAAVVRRVFPLSPAGIIDRLALRRPIYRGTAAYGHFGRTDADFPWERIDAVDSLLAAMRMV
jgi:S-adenosylmethionine synthetase